MEEQKVQTGFWSYSQKKKKNTNKSFLNCHNMKISEEDRSASCSASNSSMFWRSDGTRLNKAY